MRLNMECESNNTQEVALMEGNDYVKLNFQ